MRTYATTMCVETHRVVGSVTPFVTCFERSEWVVVDQGASCEPVAEVVDEAGKGKWFYIVPHYTATSRLETNSE